MSLVRTELKQSYKHQLLVCLVHVLYTTLTSIWFKSQGQKMIKLIFLVVLQIPTTGVYQSTFIRSQNLIGNHMKQIGLRQTTISNLMFFIQDIGICIRQVQIHLQQIWGSWFVCISYIFNTTSIEIYETVQSNWPIIGQCYVRVVTGYRSVIGYIDLPIAKMFYIPGKTSEIYFWYY